jgi:sigma-B regulation protein RsbU (phosphoserine phosphatase)
MTPDAAPTTDRLALLYRLSQTFNSSLDLDEVLNRVMDEVIAAVRAERGFVMLKDADDQLVFRVARGLDQQVIAEPKFQISRGVVESVAQSGQPVLTSDAQTDSQLNLRQSVMVMGLRSILCVPLQLKAQTIGVVYVDNRLRAGVFTPSDRDLLAAIAASAAVAIENARLYELAVDRGRLERELQVAREVQTGLLPRATPQLPGWEFAALWRPAREVAGDYYDFIPMSAHLGLLAADVTDKGMPAALFMALARSTVRAAIGAAVVSPNSAADAIANANRLISADSPNSMFVTLVYVEVAADSNNIVCVNAGHNPLLIYRPAQDSFTFIKRTGLPLGVLGDAAYSQQTETVQPGDLVLLYTDGVTEAVNTAGEEFGIARLEAVLRRRAAGPAEIIVASIRAALEAFAGGAAPLDDVTLVLAKRV